MMLSEAQIQLQKAVLWHEACGKLRAMVEVEGHRRLCEPMSAALEQRYEERWMRLDRIVEEFIDMMSDEGWRE